MDRERRGGAVFRRHPECSAMHHQLVQAVRDLYKKVVVLECLISEAVGFFQFVTAFPFRPFLP